MKKIISILLCISILINGCQNQKVVENYNPKQEIGENKHDMTYAANYFVNIQYPHTNYPLLDKAINKKLQLLKNAFLLEVKDYEEQQKSELNITYESYVKDKRYISIVLFVYQNIYQKKDSIVTLVYDSKKAKMVDLYNIYDEEQIINLANKTISYFKKRFPNECNNDQFRIASAALKKNYQHFILKKECIQFYFPAATLFENQASFSIDYEAIKEATHLKNEIVKVYKTQQQPMKINKPKIDPNKKMVALTFDDGPSIQNTPIILDALKRNQSVATFFVLGSRVYQGASLLKRMVKEGSEIGNHTYTHKQLTKLSNAQVEEEIRSTQEVIYKVTHHYPLTLRPPYGEKDDRIIHCANGKRLVNWTIDTRDWATKNVDSIVDAVMKNVKENDIILMHDLFTTSAQAACIVIDRLRAEGYQMVTISDLYKYRKDANLP